MRTLQVTKVVLLFTVLTLAACSKTPPPEGTPPTDGVIGPDGGVVVGADGVTLRADPLELDSPAAFEIVRGTTPPLDLPTFAAPVGHHYQVRTLAVNVSESADAAPAHAHARGFGFVLAVPVPSHADTGSLALALYDDLGTRSGAYGPSWYYLQGQYDPASALFLVTLHGIPSDGRSFVLVEGPDFESAIIPLVDQDLLPNVSPADVPIVAPADRWLERFEVQPVPGRPAPDAATVAAYERALDELIPVFRDVGFPAFALQTTARYRCSQNGLTGFCGRPGWDGQGYVVQLSPFVAPDHDDLDVCTDSVEGVAYTDGVVILCTRGLEEGVVSEKELDNARHELLHAVQFRYPAMVDHMIRVNRACRKDDNCDVDRGERAGEYGWVLEGTAVLAERTLTAPGFHANVRRQTTSVRPLRFVNRSLFDDGLSMYEAQDFWAYVARTHFDYVDADGNTGYAHLMRVFEAGSTPEAVDATFRTAFRHSMSLADVYWEWAKNQAFERRVDLGDDAFAGATCSPVPVTQGSTLVFPDMDSPHRERYEILPLTSRWFEIGLMDDGVAEVRVDHVAGTAPVPAKFYLSNAYPDWDRCHENTYEGDPLQPGSSATVHIASDAQRSFFLLVANSGFRDPVEIRLTVEAVPAPVLQVIPAGIGGTTLEGGSIVQPLQLSNSGGGSVAVTSITGADAWATASPTTISSIDAGETVTAAVTLNAAGLTPGSYASGVTIAWQAGGGTGPVSTHHVPVNLVVTSAATHHRLFGRISDSAGLALSGVVASVEINGIPFAATTDQAGRYDFSFYRANLTGADVRIAKAGYESLVTWIDFRSGSQTELDAQLAPIDAADVLFRDTFAACPGIWTLDNSAGGFWNCRDTTAVRNQAYVEGYSNLIAGDDTNGFVPRPYTGAYALWYGDPQTGNYLGQQAATDSQSSGGTSVAPNSGRAISPPIDLSAVSAARLEGMAWYEVESVDIAQQMFDQMRIAVYLGHPDDGGNRQIVRWLNPPFEPPLQQPDLPYTSGGNNRPAVWVPFAVDLGGVAGHSIVHVVFEFETVDALYNGFRGWLIDELSVIRGAGASPSLSPQVLPSTRLRR